MDSRDYTKFFFIYRKFFGKPDGAKAPKPQQSKLAFKRGAGTVAAGKDAVKEDAKGNGVDGVNGTEIEMADEKVETVGDVKKEDPASPASAKGEEVDGVDGAIDGGSGVDTDGE